MLSELEIRQLQPREKRYKVYDGNNLLLQVTPTNKKVWILKTRTSTTVLGYYPEISLKEARVLAATYDEVKNNITSFQTVSEEWFERQEWSVSHTTDVSQKLRSYILPAFANRDIKEINRLEILAEVRKIESLGHYETAKKVIGVCKMVFNYAIVCGYCEHNPALNLQQAIKTSKPVPMAALTNPKDIARLIHAMKEYNGHKVTKLLMFWSAYTLARPSECRRAEWQEIDFDKKLWIISSERMKMRQEHTVPLPKQCLKILKELKNFKLSDKWLFPSLRPSKSLSENAVLTALRSMGFAKEEMTAHGFRAMGSTTLNEMGYRSDLIEKSLAHGDKDKIRAVYNRSEYLEERRAMLQAYADWLDKL